jgi:hypothetical protein
MQVIVIGAGIFGVTIALELAKNHKVTLIEMNSDILQNASRVNHSRLHFGFHYPRSRATVMQCLEGYKLFSDYFSNAITSDFENYYMIEKNSIIDSRCYERFCDSLNLEYKSQYPKMDIDFDRIEASYLVKEPIFDYNQVKLKLTRELMRSGVRLFLGKKIVDRKYLMDYDVIINTTYFNVNKINGILELPQTKLRLQTVVIPIFQSNMQRIGLTVMDGKYCSIMPKGFNYNMFLLYHAAESVIFETENEVIPDIWYYGKQIIKNRFFKGIYDKTIIRYQVNSIVKYSHKYFRFLKECEIIDYWQTVRALPINDDDERLSEVTMTERGNQKIISILSGKISTCLLIAKKIII